ncbi:MAG: adenylate/guanylate cyclase domain-containing protein [Chloroherpetonaceae bacterium]|nr:adenylate/guanylate cyclase domain-containing protein [Chloroherpetonaceae bacterium]MDW8436581.1 adenylate/guanylate cyclase domain-containing protein [Chloroherpetonaceae bacterium]
MRKKVAEFFKTKIATSIWFTALLFTPVIVVLSFLLSRFAVFENLELKALDIRFNSRPIDTTFKKTAKVVLIPVNDQAQKAIKPFPWPRDYHARIIRNLTRAGAKVVAFDFVFDDIDRSGGDEEFRKAAAECRNVVVAGREPTDFTEASKVEYKSVEKANYLTIFDGTPGAMVGNVNVRQDNDGVLRRYHPASVDVMGKQFLSFAYAILKLYTGTQDTVGYDGEYFTFAGKKIPSYDGESILLNPYGPSHSFLEISADNILDDREFMTKAEEELFYAALRENGVYEQLKIDSATVAQNATLRQKLIENEELRELWAIDIFEDPLAGVQELVKGKICIVGPMFPEAKDDFPTSMWTDGRPDQNKMYGVEAHAIATQNFIDEKFIRRANPLTILGLMAAASFLAFGASVSLKRLKFPNPNALFVLTTIAAVAVFAGVLALALYIGEVSPIEYFLAQTPLVKSLFVVGVLGAALLLSYILKRANSMAEFSTEVAAIAFSVGAFAGLNLYAEKMFVEERVLVAVVPLAIAIAFAYGGSILYQYFTESRQKKMIKGFFNTYVPPALVEQMIQNPDMFKLGGERRELTMFFSDVKGFTNISESFKNEPEKLTELMNEYLGAMTDIVFKYGGTLDKYIGDAVVAFWNAPLPVEDHALKACYAAIEMQEKLKEMRPIWKAKYGHEIYSRMGINTAPVIVGNMGSQGRFAYTAMGDGMNLAARLEAANKAFGTYILISQFTYERVKEKCLCRWLAEITVQGKAEPIKVYELIRRRLPGEPEPEPAETAFKGVMAVAKE